LLEDLGVGQRFRAREPDHAAALGDVLLQEPHVDALRIPDGALEVAETGDHAPVAPEHPGGDAADVAEALDHDLLAAQLLPEALGRLVQDVHDAAAGGLPTARRAAD